MNANHVSTRINVRPLLVGLASACLGLGAAMSAAADDVPSFEARTKVVRYGDLNLANAQGVQQLYRRIVAAANEVCASGDHRSLEAFALDASCKERSIGRAVAGIGLPQLIALHAAKTGRPIANPTSVVQR
jgi:UrcA family protein